jgi:hypothetical protein
MKRIVFLLFACSMAFAQAEDSGYDDVGAYEDVSGEEQSAQAPAPQEEPVVAPPPEESVEPAPEPPARVEPIAYDDTKVAEPVTSKDESWEEAWQKRRQNVSFFLGLLPLSSWLDIIIHAAHKDDRNPDLLAYSLGYGYELFYLLEVGIMVDYTTVDGHPIISVIPRFKLNYLNFKYFRLYSYAGIGGVFWYDGHGVMFNIGLLGFEIGSKISVFGEYGFGQVGMLTCGVKLAF